MRVRSVTVLAIVLLLSTSVAVQQSRYGPERGGEDETGPYEVVPTWPQPVPGFEALRWGSTAGIFAETPNKVFIFQRGFLPAPPAGRGAAPLVQATTLEPAQWSHCLRIVDANGKTIDAWTQHDTLFVRPHKVLISPYDPEKHVWLVDDGAHQVFKFTNDGKKLVMVLGEAKVPGNDEKHFARPTDIAWLPDGTFFVSDGYTNTRVVKFDKDGKFLMTWGKAASGPKPGPAEFNTVHGIAIDNKRRVYVSDRGHSRIQIFDENGKYLDAWPNLRQPYHLFMSADQHLWVSDGISNKILKYDLSGKLLDSWGTWGQFPGGLWGGHQISVDQEGNLYVAEVFNGRAQKLRPRKGVDPARLVGQPLRYK